MAERAIAEYNGKHLVDRHGQNESDRGKIQTLQLRFADSETQKQLKKQEKYAPSLSSAALQIRQPPHRLTIKTISATDEHLMEKDEEQLELDAYGRMEYTQSRSSSSVETSPIMHLGPFPVSTFAPPPLPQPATTYVASSAGTILPPVPYSTLPVANIDGLSAISPPSNDTFSSFSSPNPTIQQPRPFQPSQEFYGEGIGASLPQNNTMPYPPPLPQAKYPSIYPAISYGNNSFTSAIPQSLSPPAPASTEPIQSILSSAAAAEKAAQAAAYLQQYLGSLGYTKDAFPNLPPLLGLHSSMAPTTLPAAFPPMPARNPSFSASSSSALQTIFPSLNNYPNYPPSDGNHLDTFRPGNSHQSLQVSSLDVESRRNAQLQKEIEALQIQQKNLIDQTRILQAKTTGQEEGRNDEIIQTGRSASPSVALHAYRFGTSWQEPTVNEGYGVQIENEDISPLSTPARTRSMTTHHISKSNMNTLLPPASALARRSSAFEARDSKMLQEQQQQQKSLVEERRGSASIESYGTERRTSIYIPPHARDRDISAYTTPASSARGSLSSDTQSTRRGSLGTAYSTPPPVTETSTAFFERRKSLSPEVPAAVSMPPPGLEHIVPKEKIILPFDKALRSFSTAGLETYASKAASAMASTAHSPEDYGVDEEAQKKIDLVKDFFSRRGSQQVPLISSEPRTSQSIQSSNSGGTSKAATTVPKRIGITRRNSSFLKLKSSFDSVKELNEGSPSPLSKVWQTDPRLQADGCTLGKGGEAPCSGPSNLTQIRPHFTFGVSHASSSVESQPSAIGKPGAYARARPANGMLDTLHAPMSGPGIEGKRKNSDASEDVVDQFMHNRVEEGASKESSIRNW
jgi:hypothetical protein